MADETKRYLLYVESNLKQVAEDAAKAKQKWDGAKESLNELKNSGKASASELEAASAKVRNLGKEYTQAKKMVDLHIAAMSSEKGSRKQLSEILKIQEQTLGKLGNAYVMNKKGMVELNPLYVEQRNRIAATKQAIIDYDLALNDGRSNIGRYGESVTGAFNEMKSSMLSAIAPIALITAGLSKLKEAFLDTEMGAKAQKMWKESIKTFFQGLLRGQGAGISAGMAGANILMAADIGKEMDALRIKQRNDLKEIARLEADIKVERFKSSDATKTEIEQIEALTIAQEKENKVIELKRENVKEELAILYKLVSIRPNDTKLIDEINEKEIELDNLRAERSFRLEAKKSAAILKSRKEMEDFYKEEAKIIEALAKQRENALKDLYKKQTDNAVKIRTGLLGQTDSIKLSEADQYRKKDMQALSELNKLRNKYNADALQENLDNEWRAYKQSVEYFDLTTNQKLLAEQNYTDASKALSQLRIEQQLNEVSAMGNVAGAISNLLGKQSAVGKGFAVAEAIMNTYSGATLALTDKTIPSTYLRIAAAAAVVINGLANVRQILAVNTGGGSSSGPRSISPASSVHKVAPAANQGANIFNQSSNNQVAQTVQNQNVLTAKELAAEIAKLPAPVVSVEDINQRTKDKLRVEVRAKI